MIASLIANASADLSERGRSLLTASEAPNARALTLTDTQALHDGEPLSVWSWGAIQRAEIGQDRTDTDAVAFCAVSSAAEPRSPIIPTMQSPATLCGEPTPQPTRHKRPKNAR